MRTQGFGAHGGVLEWIDGRGNQGHRDREGTSAEVVWRSQGGKDTRGAGAIASDSRRSSRSNLRHFTSWWDRTTPGSRRSSRRLGSWPAGAEGQYPVGERAERLGERLFSRPCRAIGEENIFFNYHESEPALVTFSSSERVRGRRAWTGVSGITIRRTSKNRFEASSECSMAGNP